MQKTNILQSLLDETQTLLQVAKDLPAPHNVTVKHQTEIINDIIIELYSIETEKKPNEKQNLAGEILTELESQTFSETETTEN